MKMATHLGPYPFHPILPSRGRPVFVLRRPIERAPQWRGAWEGTGRGHTRSQLPSRSHASVPLFLGFLSAFSGYNRGCVPSHWQGAFTSTQYPHSVGATCGCTSSLQPHCSHLHSRRLRPGGRNCRAAGKGPLRHMRSASLVPPCDSISHSRLRSGAWDQRPHSTVTLGHGDAPRTHSPMSRSSRGATSSPYPLKYQRLGFRGCGSFSHAGGPDAGSARSGSRARPCKSLL